MRSVLSRVFRYGDGHGSLRQAMSLPIFAVR